MRLLRKKQPVRIIDIFGDDAVVQELEDYLRENFVGCIFDTQLLLGIRSFVQQEINMMMAAEGREAPMIEVVTRDEGRTLIVREALYEEEFYER